MCQRYQKDQIRGGTAKIGRPAMRNLSQPESNKDLMILTVAPSPLKTRTRLLRRHQHEWNLLVSWEANPPSGQHHRHDWHHCGTIPLSQPRFLLISRPGPRLGHKTRLLMMLLAAEPTGKAIHTQLDRSRCKMDQQGLKGPSWCIWRSGSRHGLRQDEEANNRTKRLFQYYFRPNSPGRQTCVHRFVLRQPSSHG